MPLGLGCAKLTAFCEERLEDGGAVGGEDAGRDFYLMVEARVGEDFEAGVDGTALGVVGTVDETRNAGLDDRASAHATGLDGDVERGISEAVVAETAGGFAQGDHVRGVNGVAIAERAGARAGEGI